MTPSLTRAPSAVTSAISVSGPSHIPSAAETAQVRLANKTRRFTFITLVTFLRFINVNVTLNDTDHASNFDFCFKSYVISLKQLKLEFSNPVYVGSP